MNQIMLAFYIGRKDVESYYGKPPLITWGLLFPAVLIFAVYLRDPDGYLQVAPGIIGMTLLFGCTSMAAIVVTFEKRCGTLQRLLLAPVTNRTIILGKAASAAGYGITAALALTTSLAAMLGMAISRPLYFGAALLLGAATFAHLGLILSVMVREVFEAMTLLNVLRFPLILVSGVFMPLAATPEWAKPLALISPLTHVVELLRYGLSGRCAFGSPLIPLGVTCLFAVASWIAAGPAFRRGVRR